MGSLSSAPIFLTHFTLPCWPVLNYRSPWSLDSLLFMVWQLLPIQTLNTLSGPSLASLLTHNLHVLPLMILPPSLSQTCPGQGLSCRSWLCSRQKKIYMYTELWTKYKIGPCNKVNRELYRLTAVVPAGSGHHPKRAERAKGQSRKRRTGASKADPPGCAAPRQERRASEGERRGRFRWEGADSAR